MSKFKNENVMARYMAIALVLTLISVAVIGKALYIMTAKKQYWTEVADRLKRDSVDVLPNRGNILSCDEQLMATSIPEYKIFMDFQASAFENDSLWLAKLDSISEGLHRIFPQKTAAEFKSYLEAGRLKKLRSGKTGARHWPLWPRRIDLNTYLEVKALPFFNMSKYKSGFHDTIYNARRRPFGTLAQRTLGGTMMATGKPYFGLELGYDSVLRGTPGLTDRRKVLNQYMNIPVMLPVDGADIVTTIDVNMQDLAERALLDMLKRPEVNGELGVAILMEVQTGDVKAIVNMMRNENGNYVEAVNSAVSYRCEPGSVFKTASFLVALDDGVVDTSYVIHTGCGVQPMYGREMKDHNWRRGGYGDINVARTLEVSSNIGVSHVIDKYYHDNAERYVKGLYRVGIHEDLKLQDVLPGYRPPIIRMPKRKKNGRYDDNWYATTLPWMSIGYETQIAPINTVAFYNAIANDGKMMRPRFVKKVVRNGETVMEFPPVVLKERIAKPQAIKTMQTILEHVVSQGLGRKAGSPLFKVAGKTGTAQVSQGKAGYKSGVVQYWLSFAGFFPADNPRYTCIVCIKKSGLPASGGGMSGVVFHHIAEGVMARHLKLSVDDAHDENSVVIPDVKSGDAESANFILNRIGVNKRVKEPARKYPKNIAPDVTGMGAKDAVYLLESRGLKVRLQGRGKVKSQSYPYGKEIQKGAECVLVMQ
ncbi:MAG: transpeptidase family protein [Prevotella sp.]|nr:transpeptidase family protein [Prevotella sp.]MBQ9655625.1 transpeptidase family protein [Prevotella sp.]